MAQFAIDALLVVPGQNPIAVDLGTGSGAIALALATEVPHATVYGVENSPEAFEWTSVTSGSTARTTPTPSSRIWAQLCHSLTESSMLSSQPGVHPEGCRSRDPEVHLFDPAHALYGGEDGLDVVHRLSQSAARLLHPGGVLVLEHGELQGAAIRDLLAADGWRATATHRDFLGRDRATTALR